MLAAWEGRQAREGKLTASLGAFDLRFEQDGFARTSGFYDGRVIENRIVKPLPFANAKVYSGYKISGGTFPIYEDQLFTNEGGEIKVGFVLSLLRDRVIDERRFKVAESRLGLERAELDLAATRILVQHGAASAFLRWIAAGQVLVVQRDLIELARARQSLIEQRVNDGAVAAISLAENQENLLKREAGLIEAERALIERAQSLSIFLRDADGRARVPRPDELPASLPELPDVDLSGLDRALAGVFERRPEAALIDNAIELEEQRLRFGENFMLPRLDVAYELRRDFGAGSPTREGTDNILGLRVEIPLENRRYQGRTAEARANLQKLAFERRLLEDRIRIEIEKLANDIRAARALVTTTTAQVEQAAVVAEGERERLAEGASQLFLVNLREEETADARVRLIAARFEREQSLADFFAATVQLEQFYPDGRVPLFEPPR